MQISLFYYVSDYFPGVLDLSPMIVQSSQSYFLKSAFVSAKATVYTLSPFGRSR